MAAQISIEELYQSGCNQQPIDVFSPSVATVLMFQAMEAIVKGGVRGLTGIK